MSVSRRREIFDEFSAGKITYTEAAFMYMENEIAGLDATMATYMHGLVIGKHPMEMAWNCFMWKSGFDDTNSLDNDYHYQYIKKDFYREHPDVDREYLCLYELEKLWRSKAEQILSLEKVIDPILSGNYRRELTATSDAP